MVKLSAQGRNSWLVRACLTHAVHVMPNCFVRLFRDLDQAFTWNSDSNLEVVVAKHGTLSPESSSSHHDTFERSPVPELLLWPWVLVLRPPTPLLGIQSPYHSKPKMVFHMRWGDGEHPPGLAFVHPKLFRTSSHPDMCSHKKSTTAWNGRSQRQTRPRQSCCNDEPR